MCQQYLKEWLVLIREQAIVTWYYRDIMASLISVQSIVLFNSSCSLTSKKTSKRHITALPGWVGAWGGGGGGGFFSHRWIPLRKNQWCGNVSMSWRYPGLVLSHKSDTIYYHWAKWIIVMNSRILLHTVYHWVHRLTQHIHCSISSCCSRFI